MPNKKTVAEIIDKLSSKELSFGCRVIINNSAEEIVYNCDGEQIYTCERDSPGIWLDDGNVEVIGHKVYLGDCLEKFRGLKLKNHIMVDFISHWAKFNLTSDLQSIADKSGYEGYVKCDHDDSWPCNSSCWNNGKLKDKNAEALFTLLEDILNK